jgi:hypothetical protein
MATADRREMLLDKDRLHALGLQHEQSWATGNKLRDMQGPPKMARPEAAAHAAPAAAGAPAAAATPAAPAAKTAGGEA